MTRAVANFQGLEHALQRVAVVGGVQFINDSKATNVAAATRAGIERGVTVVPGVELSADVPGGDCHILGYLVDVGHAPFAAWLAARREARITRGVEIVRRVNAALQRAHFAQLTASTSAFGLNPGWALRGRA